MKKHPKRFLALVYCRCGREEMVPYTHTWADPMIEKLAVAKAGWMFEAGTGRHVCPTCRGDQ